MTIAVGQTCLHSDPASNLDAVLKYLYHAAEQQAELILFPEYALSGLPQTEFLSNDLAATVERAMHRVAEASARLSICCVLPTLWHEKCWYSSAFVVDRGEIALRHDKAVLAWAEREILQAGDTVSMANIGGVNCGLLLCAEGNGSELIALQSLAGAQMILHASAPDSKPGSPSVEDDLWTIPMASLYPLRSRLRAFGEQMWIVSAVPAHSGSLSRVIAPTGEVIGVASSEDAALIVAEIDLATFPFRNSPTFARRQELFKESCRRLLG